MARQVFPKVVGGIAIACSFIVLFYLLLNLQVAASGQQGDQSNSNSSPRVGGGVSQQALLQLSVRVTLISDEAPYLRILSGLPVQVSWQSFNPNSQKMETFSVAGTTDDRGRALFRISPGNYSLQVTWNNIKGNRSIYVDPSQRIHQVDWNIQSKTISSYTLEFKDSRGDGRVLAGEKVWLSYKSDALIRNPALVEMRIDNPNAPRIAGSRPSQKVSSLAVVGVAVAGDQSLLELTPIDPLVAFDLDPDALPRAAVYSISVEGQPVIPIRETVIPAAKPKVAVAWAGELP
ncbi:MAG TPA: hypothetical protein VIH03_00070 [Nitrososphaerales archaeon]